MITYPKGLTHDARVFHGALGVGRASAVKAREIARALGFHPRYQQTLIDELLTHGLVVCSSCGSPRGYYLPAGPDEVAPFLTQLDHRLMALGRKKAALIARYPQLRPTVRRLPPKVTRPTGRPAEQVLPFAFDPELPEGLIPDPEDAEEMVTWGQMSEEALAAICAEAVEGP